jgi:hypothetical protein
MARPTLLSAIALAALALTSLAWAASGPSSSHDSSSLASAAAGRCSKAEAAAVVRRLGWSDLSQVAPVYKVLCGSFAGPGSRTMVASLSGPDNVGMLYWAVFRFSGSDWQLLLKRRQAALLTSVGGDIEESVSIYRSGDPRCCPSGGTRSRLWHWNGARLVAGAWQRAVHLYYFVSPSRNIWCGVGDEDVARCTSRDRPHSATLRTNGTVTICRGARCVGGQSRAPDYPVLHYGETDEQQPFRCRSEVVGITCTVSPSGKGFFINRDGVRRLGP